MDIKSLIESNGLYQTVFPTGEQFIWRLLSLREYDTFCSLRNSNSYLESVFYDLVFEYCYAGNIALINGHIPAGYTASIGQLIMWLSGDGAANQAEEIEVAREQYQSSSVTNVMKRIILLAFSSYLPEDLEKFTRPQLLETFVIAESILVDRGNLSSFTLVQTDKAKAAIIPNTYTPLNTNKIMTPEKLAKQQNRINMKRENEELAGSDVGRPHVLDLPPEVLRSKMVKAEKLDPEQARKLDRKRR